MKKLLSVLAMTTLLLAFNSMNLIAQDATLTTKTATTKMGYTVLNPGETIKIYKYVHSGHSPKVADKFPVKYYFVTKSSDVLQDLTKENLKKAFPENHAFHDALDANFKEDKELINYDAFHKIYKINRLYQNSVK